MNRTSNVVVFPTRLFTTAARGSQLHNNYIKVCLVTSIIVCSRVYYHSFILPITMRVIITLPITFITTHDKLTINVIQKDDLI